MDRADQDPVIAPAVHALVDGQLTCRQAREVGAYFTTQPDAAERVAAFIEQRTSLAALREVLTVTIEPSPVGLAGLEEALCRTLRRQQQVRQTLTACGVAVVALATAAGWRAVKGRHSRQISTIGRSVTA